MKYIYIIILLILLSCSSILDLKHNFHYNKKHYSIACDTNILSNSRNIIDSEFVYKYENYKITEHKTNWCLSNWFYFDNIYFIFIPPTYLNKPVYYDKNSKFKKFKFADQKLFVLYNRLTNQVDIFDSIAVNGFSNLCETESYLYIYVAISGSYRFWKYPPDDFCTGIIAISKDAISSPKLIGVPNEEIIEIKETNGNLELISVLVKPRRNLYYMLINQLTDHACIGEFISTNIYRKYVYDKKLNQIEKNKIEY